jgi:homoserine O-succinyltransferase
MAALLETQRSPPLAPTGGEFERAGEAGLTIALVNNMPESAPKATERQFMRLLQSAAGKTRVRFHCFALPSVIGSRTAKDCIDSEFSDIAELDRLEIDGLIVTGAEPIAPKLPEERYWREFTDIVDWAKTNTRSTIWSCPVAHAAVLHLDGIERHGCRKNASASMIVPGRLTIRSPATSPPRSGSRIRASTRCAKKILRRAAIAS